MPLFWRKKIEVLLWGLTHIKYALWLLNFDLALRYSLFSTKWWLWTFMQAFPSHHTYTSKNPYSNPPYISLLSTFGNWVCWTTYGSSKSSRKKSWRGYGLIPQNDVRESYKAVQSRLVFIFLMKAVILSYALQTKFLWSLADKPK